MNIRAKVAQAIDEAGYGLKGAAAITAFLEAAAEQGWEMTPDQPTQAMLKWGARDIGKSMSVANHIERSKSCYQAMRDATEKFEWGGE